MRAHNQKGTKNISGKRKRKGHASRQPVSKWSEAREGKYGHEVETDGSGKTTEIATEF